MNTTLKTIHNQTFRTIRVNNRILRPGETMGTDDSVVDIYQSDRIFLRFLDSSISRYLGSDEFVIYITDQHGLVKQANFADSTIFLSLDTCKSCLYMARDDRPIINPPVYFYNKVQQDKSTKFSLRRWFKFEF